MYTLVGLLFIAGLLVRLIFPNAFTIVKNLNQIIVFSSFPATVFLSMIVVDFSAFSGFSVLAVWVVQIICALLVLICAKLLHWPKAVLGAFLLVCVLGNTSFLGFPLVTAFLGKTALPYAVFYDQFGSFLALSIFLPIIIALFSGQTSPHWLVLISRVLRFPPFIALLLGLLCHGVRLPLWLNTTLEFIALTMAPLAALVIGLQFKLDFTDCNMLFTGLCIKMIVPPIIVWILAQMLMPNVIEYKATLLQSAMPPMMTASILVMAAGLATRTVSALLSMGMLFSLLTLPLINYFFI